MAKKLNEVKVVAVGFYPEDFKVLGLTKNNVTTDVKNVVRKNLGLKERARTRSANSIVGVARKKDYTDEEKQKIVEFMKSIGTDKTE